jgi:hypothetical protein
MKIAKKLGFSLVALSMVALSTAPALAMHGHHKVCKVHWHHGHKVRVCHRM